MMVEQRRWMTAAEFTELLDLCQFQPGGNIINISVVIGARFAGAPGAVVAFTGLMAAPMAVVIGLGFLYEPILRPSGPGARLRRVGRRRIGTDARRRAENRGTVALLSNWCRRRSDDVRRDRAVALAAAAGAAGAGCRLHPAGRAFSRTNRRVSDLGTLGVLSVVFAELSLLTLGGANSILPEMQRHVVQVHP
jgi:hypothetical protein